MSDCAGGAVVSSQQQGRGFKSELKQALRVERASSALPRHPKADGPGCSALTTTLLRYCSVAMPPESRKCSFGSTIFLLMHRTQKKEATLESDIIPALEGAS